MASIQHVYRRSHIFWWRRVPRLFDSQILDIRLALRTSDRQCARDLDAVRVAAAKADQEAGIPHPREQIRFIAKEGEGWKDVLNGFFDADGAVPCQIEGGLKCFGHPIGASGLRMIYENDLQLLGRAGPRQRQQPPVFALGHNLGGMPHQNVSSIAIVGLADA